MKTLLAVVAETFAIVQRGVIVTPGVDLAAGAARTFVVELRRPDGSVARAEARADLPFFNPPSPRAPRHMLRFETLSKDDLPPGTEIWLTDDA